MATVATIIAIVLGPILAVQVQKLMNVNYLFPSATIISSVRGAPYRGLDCGCYVSLSFRFLASSAR